MSSVYNSWLVGLSVLVAIIVSYTALRLAARVAATELSFARAWLAAGSLAMGFGIWTMHFVGMLAFSLPVPLTYTIPTTAGSLAIAVVTSGFALSITSGAQLTLARLSGAALLMGTGIAGMHYMGMSAIPIFPGIRYDPWLVVLSIYIAVAASFVALWLFFRLRHGKSVQKTLARIAAAVVMGLAISGMHYTGMAASRFTAGAFCRGGVRLDQPWLAASIGILAVGVLIVTLVTALYDSHRQSRARNHLRNLEEVNARLQHQATHDALTGLPNRVLFTERVNQEIIGTPGKERAFAIFALDLDRFKVINDTLGHAVGDQLLQQVSRRLAGVVRLEDTVARSGGDEFLIMICNIEARGGAAAVAAAIGAQVDREYEIDTVVVHTSASIGGTVYPADGSTTDVLIARADEAMYFAKQNGRNTFHAFNVGMSVFSQERLDMEKDLRRALPLRQFELHYQPKMDVMTGRIASVEALLRWRHPERGFVSPAKFIPLAEESGLMFAIDEWVLREGCRQAREWQTSGLPFVRVAVNVSPVNFRESKFLQAVRTALTDFDLDPMYLEIELTETTVMRDAQSAVTFLEDLSRMGVLVSIDDFGTGYSSMSYLRKLPLDKLKIDRSFISDLAVSPDAAAIVNAIISLAHSLRLKVVAEGVESEAQLDQLRVLGCDQYQGFLKSPAVPPAALAAMVLEQVQEPTMMEPLDFQRTQSKLGAFRRGQGG
jgi:diguanylate cyclase (GGDEF)-like protein